jgi:hypothetical protein
VLCAVKQQQQLAHVQPSSSRLQQPWRPERHVHSSRCSVAAQEQPTAGATGEQASEPTSSTTEAQPSSNISTDSQQAEQQQQPEASTSSSSSSSSNGDSGQADSESGIQVKVLSEPREVNAVANLRAEAYYEVGGTHCSSAHRC